MVVLSTHDFSQGNDSAAPSARSDLDKTGFACMQGFVNPQVLLELQREALRMKNEARPVYSSSDCQYRAHLSGLGAAGLTFLAGRSISKLLDLLFQAPFSLERDSSCYTFYQPGDFLGPHLDRIEHCTVTAILYLDATQPEHKTDRTGLELHILGISSSEENQMRTIIPSVVGTLVVGLGSENWHERPMLQDGEYLTALTSCFTRSPTSKN